MFSFFLYFSDISHATMFGYLGDSNLSEVMEGSVDIPAFVKQGDIVTIQAKTKIFPMVLVGFFLLNIIPVTIHINIQRFLRLWSGLVKLKLLMQF